MEEGSAAKAIIKLWEDGEPYLRKQKAIWKVNKYRRQGVTGVWLTKDPDRQQWRAYSPPGTMKQVPALNKAARLCRLLAAAIFVDEPEPEATPSRDEDESRDKAEFATRILQDIGAEGYLENSLSARQAFDLASVYGSGFRRFYTDPAGGGIQKVDVLCSSAIQHIDQLQEENPVDPATGQPYPPPHVTKWVLEDGTLTDDESAEGIRTRELPRLCKEVLKAPQVRLLPATARDIWDARGALIGAFVPLGDLRANPAFAPHIPTDEAELKKLIADRSPKSEDTLSGGSAAKKSLDDQQVSDDALVWTVTLYYKSGGIYPKGFYGLAAGEGTPLFRSTWYDDKAEQPMDIPLDQFKQWEDEDTPYGYGLMDIVGPGNEIRASQVGSMLEHLDRFGNRKVFYPITAAYQPRAMQAATGTYIPMAPGSAPVTEDLPDYPPAVPKMFELISQEMDHDSGLEQPLGGQNPTNVDSALHARTILEQVNVGLSDVKNNTKRALERGWRIQLQLLRRDFTVPQRLKTAGIGDDGAYKGREWSNIDLMDVEDVRLHPGSLSMLAPSAKAALAQSLSQTVAAPGSILTTEELRRITIGNVGGLLGLQDDPARERVMRQITEWVKGPPVGWAPPPQPGIAGPLGPVPTPVPMQPDILAEIWAPEPSDDEPTVAVIRHLELKRLTQSTRFSRWPEPWKTPVRAEYARMRQAAQIQTIPQLQEQIQTLTQQGQETGKKLQEAEAKPKFSVSVKGADLDATQTQAILAQEGLQVGPPSGVPSGDMALQQVGELHQGVQQALADVHAKIDGMKAEKTKTPPAAANPGLTIVNPSKETEQAIAHLSAHLQAGETKHAEAMGAVGQQLEQVKQLAANTALHVQNDPRRAVGVEMERDASGKAIAIVTTHADGSISRAPILRRNGRIAGVQK